MSSSALAAGLRQLRRKLALPQHRDDSDEELLSAFTSRRDDSAFAVLVHRHGPMVLQVCRRVLGHEQDTEDAFQTVFLVLARQAASLRNKGSLAGFLHGTAYRIARDAKRSAARRRKHEGRAPSRPPVDPVDEISWREIRTLLDEEIARLPETYRSAFVLCYLEDLSRAEAAQRLGLKECTLLSRLAKARKRLAQRLSRRGVELTAVLTTPLATALPAGLMASTVKAALATTAGDGLASVSSAAVAEWVHGTAALMVSKGKLAVMVLLSVTLLAGAGTYWMLALPQPAEEPAAQAEVKPAPAKNNQSPPKDKDKDVKISGSVLDADGKPVQGARLYLPSLKAEQLRPLATSDSAGRFRFQVMPAAVGFSPLLREPWSEVYVVAVAEGHGPGIAIVGDPAQAEKLILRLAKDEVPIKGRVLDLQGKPVAGVTVRVDGIGVPKKGDLTEFLEDLKGGSGGNDAESNFLTTVEFSHFCPPVKTGADGRFQIRGIGGERLAQLTISGPTIETRQVMVRTRRGETMHKWAWAAYPPDDRQNRNRRLTYYGAEFEHAAAPTKPIIGVVRDKDTGKPLANAIIQSGKAPGGSIGLRTDGHNPLRTVTDKDGRYRLVGLAKGNGNVILAESPEGAAYLGRRHFVEDTLGLDPVTVDLELRRGVLVKGCVTDKKTGAGVEARIQYFLFHDNPSRDELLRYSFTFPSQHTKADGSFRMVVPPGHGLLAAWVGDGRYLVGVGAEKLKRVKHGDLGFLSSTDPLCRPTGYHRLLEIDPGKDVQSVTCRVEVDPGLTLNGIIVGPEGKPLAGACICGLRSYNDGSYWEAEPLRTAEFSVHALPPDRPRNLLAIHEGKHLAGALRVRGDEKGLVTFKLQPWGTIMGRLVTPDGKPYTKGELTVGSHPLSIMPRDKTGRFRVEGLVPGLKYQMKLSPGDFVGKEVTVLAGETKDLGEMTVRPME